jgi:hypothetical protein
MTRGSFPPETLRQRNTPIVKQASGVGSPEQKVHDPQCDDGDDDDADNDDDGDADDDDDVDDDDDDDADDDDDSDDDDDDDDDADDDGDSDDDDDDQDDDDEQEQDEDRGGAADVAEDDDATGSGGPWRYSTSHMRFRCVTFARSFTAGNSLALRLMRSNGKAT